VHTNYRLVVLTESDWVMVILNAGQHLDALRRSSFVRAFDDPRTMAGLAAARARGRRHAFNA
jgi:hypothetical protein